MEVTFDPFKDAANIAKHGLSLADAAEFEMAEAIIVTDTRFDYAEARYRAFGRWTERLGAWCSPSGAMSFGRSVIAARMQRRCVVMADDAHRAMFDEDDPEWTNEDFARARPAHEVLSPEVIATFGRKRGRPPGSNKEQVAIRIDKDVLARFRAGGAGWQSRMNAALRATPTEEGDLMAAARAQGGGAHRWTLAA